MYCSFITFQLVWPFIVMPSLLILYKEIFCLQVQYTVQKSVKCRHPGANINLARQNFVHYPLYEAEDIWTTHHWAILQVLATMLCRWNTKNRVITINWVITWKCVYTIYHTIHYTVYMVHCIASKGVTKLPICTIFRKFDFCQQFWNKTPVNFR